QPVEEAGDLLGAAQEVLHGAAVVVLLLRGQELLVGARPVADQEVAARGQRGQQPPDDPARLVVLGQVAEDPAEDQRHGLAEVEGVGGGGEDLVDVVQVGVQVGGGPLRGGDQQGPRVRQHQGVVVDVDDARLGGDRLRELVGVARRGQPGADVEELAHPGLAGQVADPAPQEGAERAGVLDDLGEGLAEPVPGLAVDGVVVLAAEPVVPDAGRVRHRRVHRGNGRTTRRIHGDILVDPGPGRHPRVAWTGRIAGTAAGMASIGYFLSCEQFGPKELIDQAKRAEAAGFEKLWISDHFHPWNDEQGQSPFVWGVIGALSEATSLPVTTAVTCPTFRIHPAITAQAAATAACQLDGRFVLGVGSGEALNEHVLADPWPSVGVRLEMLEEAIDVIRLLHRGEEVSHHGTYYEVQDARIYTLPAEPVPIYVSGFGPQATRLAGRIGDGYVTTIPDADLIGVFKESGGADKPVQAGTKDRKSTRLNS